MSNCDEAVSELDRLLAEVHVPALLPHDAERILARSRELAHDCPSEAVARRHARIQDSAVAARARPGSGGHGERRRGGSLPPRMAALEEALRGHAAISIALLRHALADGGFHRAEELSAADALHFQAIVAGPLLRLEGLYRGLGDVSAGRLEGAGRELDELAGFVPACMKDADATLAGLRAFIARRQAEAEARARLERLVPELEGLLRHDDPPAAAVQAAREALEENPWVAAHPDHAEVGRAAALLDRVREKRGVCDELQRLLHEVSQALSSRPDQVGEAARRVDDVYGRARGHAVETSESLRRAAGRVVEAARERLHEIADPSLVGLGVEELRRVAGEAAALRDALRLIPEPLAPDAAAQARVCQALAQDADARVLARVLAEVRAGTATLAPADVPACAERLRASEYAEVRRHGERLARLHAAALTLERAGDTLDEAALDRLQADAGEAPPGPFVDSVGAALEACREARAALDEVEAAMQGDAEVDPLRPRLDALRARFPAWARVARAREGLDDLALVRRVRECAARGESGLPEALRLARGITLPARRERVAAALEFLRDVGRELPRLRRALERRPGNAERGVRQVVAAARVLFDLLAAERAATCAEEFPGPCREADAAARQALLDDVPDALREWVEGAVERAAAVEELDRVEAVFSGWAGELGAAFPAFVASHGRQLLETRRVELQLAPMLAEGRFDPAGELLRRAGGRLHPDELARQQRRVASAAAVAAWRHDGDAALDGVVQAVLQHGADAALVDVLLDAFAATGSTAALAAVAGQGGGPLAAFPGVAQLARWCMLFQRGRFDELASELGSDAARRGNLDDFVSALARSDRCGQAIYVLDALRRQGVWSPPQAARLDGAVAALRQALDQANRALAARVNELEAALDADPPDASPAGPPSLADVQAATRAAAKDTDAALATVASWQDELNETMRWLPRALVPRRTPALLDRLRALRSRLRAGREVLAHIEDAVTGARQADLQRWKELQRRFGLAGHPVGRLLAAERLVHAYVQDWQFIADIVHWLVEAHRACGAGVTPEKLEAELRRLDTYRYDFQADRFNLLPLLGGAGMDEFTAGLRAQVAEVDRVEAWLRQSRAVLAAIVDPLHLRLRRWQTVHDRRKPLEAAEICALLRSRTGENPSAAELYDRLPRPVRSTAAQETLRAGTADPWFADLEAAVSICGGASAGGSPGAG